MPTVDDFRALARSGPWRFTHAHLTRRRREPGTGRGREQVVEAWVRRPGRLTYRENGGRLRHERETPPESAFVEFTPTGSSRRGRTGRRRAVWAQEFEPLWRPDGLVEWRPGEDPWDFAHGEHPDVHYGDAILDTYEWVAMLDPFELAVDVDLSDVTETTHHGRRAWAARAVPREGYEPRCPCCPLLWSEVSDREEYGDEADLDDTDYPEAWDVVLDHATAIVVSLAPVWGPGSARDRDDLAFDVEIHTSQGRDA